MKGKERQRMRNGERREKGKDGAGREGEKKRKEKQRTKHHIWDDTA